MAQFTQWLWRQEYWLPPGFTWEDMQETDNIHYPQPRHLLLGFPIALLLVTLQFLFESFSHLVLPPAIQEEVSGLAKQCDLQPRQVERWFRYRLNQNRPSMIKKFCEASWRTVHSLIYLFMALAVLYDQPWLWNSRKCWDGYLQKPLQPSLYGYYLMHFSLYWSWVISIPFKVKQKDFNMVIVHHVIAVLLTGCSYCANFISVGSLVMILHDVPNSLLYAAKMFNYLKWQKTCNTLFIIFSVVFLLARGIIFPYKVLYSTYYYSMELYQPCFAYFFFNALLMLLYLLDVFWSCMIILMLYRFLIHGKVKKDVRSDSEDSEEDDMDDVDQKAEQKNTQNKTAPLSRNCAAGVQMWSLNRATNL